MQILESNTTDELCIVTETRASGKVYPAYASHEVYEIYLVVQGERNMYIGTRLYRVCCAAAMIASHVPHRSYGSTAYRGVCIEFSRACLKQYLGERDRDRILALFQKEIIQVSGEAAERIFARVEAKERGELTPEQCLMEAVSILEGFLADSRPEELLSRETDLSSFGGYIQRNFTKLRNLEEISREFGVTKSYLCRAFKKQTGITVTQYINALRVQYACRLLGETDMPVRDISRACGFRNLSYFNRVFREIMEDTPLRLRVRSRELNMTYYK